jgi:hypothetical protein
LLALAGCHSEPPPVAPGPPLAAEPDVKVGAMDEECQGLTSALQSYGECPNLDPDERAWAKAVVDTAQQSFEAAKKGHPTDEWQHAIAVACRKATSSLRDATTRCLAGPRPKGDY